VVNSDDAQNLSMFAFKVLLSDMQQVDVNLKDFVRMTMQHECFDFKEMLRLAHRAHTHSLLERVMADSALRSEKLLYGSSCSARSSCCRYARCS